LDNDTERSVMEAIDRLGSERTVLIIAHRLTTLKKCDLVVELAGGGIRRSGSYQELVAPTR
jgi:ATP-binding cassette subfamily B protein